MGHRETWATWLKENPEYRSWVGMRQRCGNHQNPAWHRYGGRGIAVALRWEVFENFLEDMGKKPPGATLERVDNAAGYSKENCRWATYVEQNRNRRSNRLVTYMGIAMPLIEAAERSGLSYRMLRSRLGRGWGEQELFLPRMRGREPST